MGVPTGEPTLPYAVEMYFDPDTETAVRAIWSEMAAAGVDDTQLRLGFRPHLSLAVCGSCDEESLLPLLARFAREIEPFPVTLGSVGLFADPDAVVFLAPIASEQLIEVHRRFTEQSRPFVQDVKVHYEVGRWIPHCTLARKLRDERTYRAISIAAGVGLPWRGRIVALGLSMFRPAVVRSVYPFGRG